MKQVGGPCSSRPGPAARDLSGGSPSSPAWPFSSPSSPTTSSANPSATLWIRGCEREIEMKRWWIIHKARKRINHEVTKTLRAGEPATERKRETTNGHECTRMKTDYSCSFVLIRGSPLR